MNPWLSVTEVAEYLGVTRSAVLQRIKSGSLPATKVGNAWSIHCDDVQKLEA